MEELQEQFDKIKLTSDAEVDLEEPEKISHRKLRLMKMKNKKEEKKLKKQNFKGSSNNKISLANNKDSNDNNYSDQKSSNKQNEENINDIEDDVKHNNTDKQDYLGENTSLQSKKKYEVVNVEYCQVCTMPYEYCEYGNAFNECKEMNKEKFSYDIVSNNAESSSKRKTKEAPQNTTQKITIQRKTRARKKVVTVVTGLHQYVKLEKIAKIFSRFYACGSSVIKGTDNNPDQIDIQGDVEHNIIDVIIKNCPELTEDCFVILPPK
ncbi:translation initiation factor SUI1, putative [Plasmodium malariae]|uniref:Translation initiation factor SUI1, putative n=1 Tax=Plasmodium malariae TaxID=5858 RepID=A0A1C3L2H5_PLAMA|nr:translation initiation factor SUI1, putative [Plasmodium malariae]